LINCPAPEIPSRDLPGVSATERKDAAVQEKHLINFHMQREKRRRKHKERRHERRDRHRQKRSNPKKGPKSDTNYVDLTRETFSNVHVLQFLVFVLCLVLIVQYSWRNIFPRASHQIGKISFNPSDFLGKGCMGTSVFRGSFDGRDVAVKRLLVDSYQLAEREIDLLRQADHPNLLRYFCSEKDRQFIFIALELCQGDLDFYVQHQIDFEHDLPRDAILSHCCAGVEQLHSLGVIHRDIKPSNILITYGSRNRCRRAVIADFGLSRQVNPGRHSISVTDLHGTEGWAAPEVFQCDVSKITYSVDIFSLGCVFYFVLSDGKHPYGHEFFMRQARIRQGKHDLGGVSPLHEHLILNMIQPEPEHRLPMKGVQEHPIFWNSDKKIRFLALTSDRLSQNPQEQNQIDDLEMSRYLEMNSERIGGEDWRLRLESELQEDLRKFRNYKDGIKDLLRALRNKRHHFRDLTIEARNILGDTPDSFFQYWSRAFPNLLRITYEAVSLDFDKTNDPFFSIFFDKSYCSILAANVRRVSEEVSRYFNNSSVIQNQEKRENETPAHKMVDSEHKNNFKQKVETKIKEKEEELMKSSPQRTEEVYKRPETAEDNSARGSPKIIPYSHKIKTKLIFQDKSPKRIRYRPNPENTQCLMLDGSYQEIHKDVPIRSDPDVTTLEDKKNSIKWVLGVIESHRLESERNRCIKEGFKTKKNGFTGRKSNAIVVKQKKEVFSNRFDGLPEYDNLEPRLIPELLPQSTLQAIPEIISNSSAGALLQRGLSYVRQLSTSSDTTNSISVGHQIFEHISLDGEEVTETENLLESDEEMIFAPIGTPKSSRVIVKKQSPESPVNDFDVEGDDAYRCLIMEDVDPDLKVHLEDALNNKKTSNRRKRPTKKKKRR